MNDIKWTPEERLKIINNMIKNKQLLIDPDTRIRLHFLCVMPAEMLEENRHNYKEFLDIDNEATT